MPPNMHTCCVKDPARTRQATARNRRPLARKYRLLVVGLTSSLVAQAKLNTAENFVVASDQVGWISRGPND